MGVETWRNFFCIEPRLVTLLTAVLGLVFWLVVLIVDIEILAAKPAQEKTLHELNESSRSHFKSSTDFVFYVLEIVALVLASINLICSILMIYGGLKRSKYFLLPWILWNSIQIGFLCVVILCSITLLILFPIWFISLPVLGAYLYLWLYVLVCYKEFLKASDQYARIAGRVLT